MIYFYQEPVVHQASFYPRGVCRIGQASPCQSDGRVEKKSVGGESGKHQDADGKSSKKESQHGSTALYRGSKAQVIETEEASTLFMDLPGVKVNDLNVQVEGNVITVDAERKTGDKVTSKCFRLFEANERTEDLSKLTVELSDGVLTITVPKKAAPEPVAVDVIADYPPDEEESDDSEKQFQLTVDVPGVNISNLKVEFQYNHLSICAERKKGNFVSKIDRSYSVNPETVDTTAFQGFLADGVLTVTAPRKQAPPVKKIAVLPSTEAIQRGTKEEAPAHDKKEEKDKEQE